MLVSTHALRQDTRTEEFNVSYDTTPVKKKRRASCDKVLDVFLCRY